jgi:hypothetical protein
LKLPLAIALASIVSATAGILVLAPDTVETGGAADEPKIAVVRALNHWDSGWYATIAQTGYYYRGSTEQSPVAFFPGYAIALRPLIAVGINRYVAGELVTLVCGLAALFLLLRWERKVRVRQKLAPGNTATLALALYPFAFYLYGVMYSDALYLLLAVGAFTCLEDDRPALAAVLGALATSCRPIAPALMVGLLARSIELRVRAQQKIRIVDLLPAFAGLGFAAYMFYLWVDFGDPLAFAHVQSAPGWDQPPGFDTWAKVTWFKTMFPRVAPIVAVRLGGHALATLLALLLVIPTWKKLGPGYGLYCLIAIGLPALSSKDFMGLGRYAIAAFPIFLALGLMLEDRPRVRRVWLTASGLVLVVLAFNFGAGAYVS